ncbi:imelysin family protein [Pseudothioclava nitratireducens]|uniref:imelysin family protein n=1 Tax=Pseudothioclava nitratireducens TaxID=1928646 RepID=UPI0023DB05A7|nr:imelysin family protein [Defluviimonas nitratireducens]MDF1621422.1 imelysin family protein [Defluviimonas nitratireducens]
MTRTLTACIATTALISAPLLAHADAPATLAVLDTYADIAEAGYGDSVATAESLRAAVEALIAAPSPETLMAARAAWVAARIPYQQTEAFRFGNAIVDDWEGKVNAWPLDEGLIDYVDPGSAAVNEENDYALLNVIANPTLTIAGQEIDATEITPALLGEVLHEAEGIEANVATGYHAIEFLLWGQDLNGTDAGAGERPYTDFIQGADCTGGNCDRRADYLRAATDLLIADLQEMAANWAEGGAARAAVLEAPEAGISTILTGMGSLSYGELAGERIKLGLMLHDPEEEHDCFSDMTHLSHYYDGVGIRNVYTGSYTRIDGREVSGPSLSDLVAARAPEVDAQLRSELDLSVAALGRLKERAESGMAYDQMLAMGNDEGRALIEGAVEALVAQTRSIERAVSALGAAIEVEGSDSLDNPSAVFQ